MKRLVKLLLVVGGIAAVLAVLKRRPAPPTASPTAPPVPVERPGPVEAPVVPEPVAWLEPDPGGACPDGYPVKAKNGSTVFHVPGGSLYERTSPDRCYASPEAAEADGLRASKR